MRLLIVVLAAFLLVLGAVAATAAGGTSTPPSYYLALGDSMAYGYQPIKEKPGAVAADYDTGFVDVVAARLRKISPDLRLGNYGCPGESTVTFARGGCPAFPLYFKPHDAFRGSQLAGATAFLRTHAADDGLVTLSLYGNDWLPVVLDECKGKVACVRKRGPKAIAAFESRLSSIVRQLRAAAPTAEIVVTGAWNPEPSQLASLKPIYRSLEEAVARAAAASQAPDRTHDPRLQRGRYATCPEGSALPAHVHLLEG
jgi:lysophospholipase L1-like esterase